MNHLTPKIIQKLYFLLLEGALFMNKSMIQLLQQQKNKLSKD